MAKNTDEEYVIELLNGFIKSKVLMTGFEIGLFSLVANEGATREQILERLKLPKRSGEILINTSVALNLLVEEAGGRLRTNPAYRTWLVKDDQFRATTYLIDYYRNVYDALSNMTELVRTDGAASTFKMRDYFKEDVTEVASSVAEEYSKYMEATTAEISKVLLEVYPFTEHKQMLDLCGCTGALVSRVVEATPGLQGAFIDVPACVAIAKRNLANDPVLKDRITPIAGDVFKMDYPKADVITICRSAMDWDDPAILEVFKKVHRSLPVGGRFVVVERMLPEQHQPESLDLHLRTVYFLAKSQTTRYRTAEQFTRLLNEAGFQNVEVRIPPKSPYEFFQSMKVVVGTKG